MGIRLLVFCFVFVSGVLGILVRLEYLDFLIFGEEEFFYLENNYFLVVEFNLVFFIVEDFRRV